MKNGVKWFLKAFSMLIVSIVVSASAAPGFATVAYAADTQAPTKPAALKASSVGTAALTLSWQPSADNVGVTSYAVFKDYAYLTYTTSTSCKITGLSAGKTYTFYVAGQDKAGNISGKSNIIQVTTAKAAAAPAATPTSTSTSSSKSKIVAGYYASWAAYSGYTPSDIPAGNLTHILYAFANIGSDYRIAIGDPEVDYANLKELAALKSKYPKLKTLISVGGWTWSGKFSDMASTAARRAAFADSAVAFMKKYGLDGVDLDWEYPVGGGMAGNSARAADKTNFSLLLQTLRQKLDAQGKKDGKKYLLTIAGGADTSYVNNVQLKTIAPYLDFATVMTYDMHGAYDAYTDLNAPLYPGTGSSPQRIWSCDQAVKAWSGAGFPKSKLLLGVPFYGHLYSGVTGGGSGLYKRYFSMKTVTYDEIVKNYLGRSGYTRQYGAQGKTPWLFNGSTFITYEDPTSLAAKAAYVNAQGLGGCGIWELSENANGTLLGTLRSKLK
jgi:chitinase